MTSPSPGPDDCSGGMTLDNLTMFLISMAVILPLIMVKDIKKFAWTHIALNIMIVTAIVLICYSAVKSASQTGFKTECIEPIGTHWYTGLGASIFTFEGFGIILPVKELMSNKKDFKPVTTIAITFYGVFVIAYAYVALFGFGADRS